MKNLFSVLLAAFLLAACGAKQVGSTNPKTNPKDTSHQGSSCPTVPAPAEQLTLTYSHAVAAKVAVKFPGESTYHFSECASIPQTGMQVSVARPISSALVVNIDLNRTSTDAGGVTTLPASQQLEIVDLHNCDSSTPTPIFNATAPLALSWKMAYPGGASCAPQVTGTYTQSVSGEQEALLEEARE